MTEDAPSTVPDAAPDSSQPDGDTVAEAADDSGSAAAPDATPGTATDAEPAVDRDDHGGELKALKERVSALEREVETEREHGTDYMRKWQQAQADLANFRRRAQQEQEQFAALAAAQAMEMVLPALDSFERAFKTLPESLARLTWIEGIALVDFQLRRVLELHGVEPFEPHPGEALDPTRHQAVAHTETSAHPEGSVVEVVQRGYTLHGRALRPALVRIARAPAASGETTAAGARRTSDTPTDGDTNNLTPGDSGPAPPGDTP